MNLADTPRIIYYIVLLQLYTCIVRYNIMYTVTVAGTTPHRVFLASKPIRYRYRTRGQFSLLFSSRCQLIVYNRFRLNTESTFLITDCFIIIIIIKLQSQVRKCKCILILLL